MKQIVIVKPGTVSPKDKEKLTKAGIILIEHPEPDAVRVVNKAPDSKYEDIAMAALHGISDAQTIDGAKSRFVSKLNQLLQQKGEKG